MRLALAVAVVLAMRGIAAAVLCGTITAPPGAVYLYSDAPTNAFSSGNSFQIDGNDHALAGGPGPAPPIVGVAAHSATNAQQFRDSLSSNQTDNVLGLGFDLGPPTVPSIAAVSGPDAATVDQLVTAILANPHVVMADATITGNTTMGEPGFPTITHLVGKGAGVTIASPGNLLGFGVLIVEGSLTVQGTFAYGGLIIVRGPLTIGSSPTYAGFATIYGSAWTTDFSIGVGGSAIMVYSRETLGLAMDAGAALACTQPVCGDAVLDAGEQCDDGNTVAGDCCSAACTFEPSTSACADDGNACTFDHCDASGTCVHDDRGAPCDDGDACTDGDTCVAGSCVGVAVDCGPCMQCGGGGCVAAPAVGCREPLVPSVSRLGLTDFEDDRRDRMSWRWRTTDGFPRADLGDPLGTTVYTLCLYGGPSADAVLLRAAISPATGCDTSCGWTATSRGYRYRDRLASAGISRIDLAARSPGIGSIRVSGAGAALHMPGLPFPTEAELLLQLRADGGACWQTTFPTGNLIFRGSRLTARGGQP